jgi:hypothetical protein
MKVTSQILSLTSLLPHVLAGEARLGLSLRFGADLRGALELIGI